MLTSGSTRAHRRDSFALPNVSQDRKVSLPERANLSKTTTLMVTYAENATSQRSVSVMKNKVFMTNVISVLSVIDYEAATSWCATWLGRQPDIEPVQGRGRMASRRQCLDQGVGRS